MRKGSIADTLMGDNSTFSNKRVEDKSLVDKRPLIAPQYIIKFGVDESKWFTVWNNNIIKKYNGEKKQVVSMRPYINELYNPQLVNDMINMFDSRAFHYRDLITFKLFQKEMQLLKPRK